MKHKLTLLAIILTALTMPVMAQYNSKNLKNPDEATYSIKGTMESNPSYELLNPTGQNITFKHQVHYYGITTEGEQVRFSLQNAETTRPNKFEGDMIFWSWNDDAGEWQVDVESGSGRREYESSAFVNFMLVLDCSRSMKNEIREMKNNAKYILQRLLNASNGKGNIRVGVIGFSTVEYSKNHTIDPVPLTQSNFNYLCKYIEKMEAEGGTALYYSVNAAVECLQKDYRDNITGKPFAGSAIIAFTDGHDNTSIDESLGYRNSKEYYAYTKTHFPTQTVNNIDILSFCVGLRGNDITSDNIWQATCNQFREVFDNFTPINRIDELHGIFDNIATNLINRNTVLNLRVAKGISGRVGWTFPEEKAVVKITNPKLPKQPGKFWLGLGLEAGNSVSSHYRYSSRLDDYYYDYDHHFAMALRADATWPICGWFAVGATASLGWGDFLLFKLGPLAKFTFSNGSALLVGAGIQNWNDDSRPYYCLGWKFKSPWYINANIHARNYYGGFSIGVGYSIYGGRKRK